MLIRRTILILYSGALLLCAGCTGNPEIKVPDRLGNLKRTMLITGEEAIQVINQMHGLPVASEVNFIAEYGEDPKDLLYVTSYKNADEAEKFLLQMVTKLQAANSGPFSHLHALKSYGKSVYVTLGLGAIHYIYRSSRYLLWLHTYQNFGRELPENLIREYPVEKEVQNL